MHGECVSQSVGESLVPTCPVFVYATTDGTMRDPLTGISTGLQQETMINREVSRDENQ